MMGSAETHTPAKVWVSYGEYTISESNLYGGILHLRYENDIPIIIRYSMTVVRWKMTVVRWIKIIELQKSL